MRRYSGVSSPNLSYSALTSALASLYTAFSSGVAFLPGSLSTLRLSWKSLRSASYSVPSFTAYSGVCLSASKACAAASSWVLCCCSCSELRCKASARSAAAACRLAPPRSNARPAGAKVPPKTAPPIKLSMYSLRASGLSISKPACTRSISC